MSSSEPLIQCPDPACQFTENPLGQRVCLQCETPLYYRYLWAIGTHTKAISVGQSVGDRYYVIAPRTWLDLRPAIAPATPEVIPAIAQPYFQAHPYRLHIPGVYDIWTESPADPSQPIVLLENVPLDPKGELRPTLAEQWASASAARQIYWLWQIVDLWPFLSQIGAHRSLLAADNLRIDDWRVRLRELLRDVDPALAPAPTLKSLAESWRDWIPAAQPQVMQPLQEIWQQMQAESAELDTLRTQLNHLLLAQTAQMPLRLQIAGATTTGPQRSHNEDSCYPNSAEMKQIPPNDPAWVPQLGMVCDGIGGHEGGEVASQLAVRSLRLQMQALLSEVAEQEEIVEPETLMDQIGATIRVVNNLIAAQNDLQQRSQRQRMGTTLAMGLIVPQKVQTETSWNYAHELYIAHVGDSRAYWLTPNGCHLLTVDDNLASRDVLAGRRLYADAHSRPESEALTQALGTREADFLQPHVQRFVIEEDGVLLLCTDGLSDHQRVEQSWATYIGLITREMMPLESAVNSWIELANQKNGHDNTAVVLMHCHLTASYPQLAQPSGLPSTEALPESELTEASKALLYGEAGAEPEPVTAAPMRDRSDLPIRSSELLSWILRLMVVIAITTFVGVIAWWQLSRSNFQPNPTPEPGLEESEPLE